jgi:hypothetical protein
MENQHHRQVMYFVQDFPPISRSIMLIRLRIFLALIFASLSVLPALAEERVVPANKTSVISFWLVYSPETCHVGGKPTTRVSRQPEHGTLEFKWVSHKIEEGMYNCSGRVVKGMAVTYRPNKGYRGTDVVKFGMSSSVYSGTGWGLNKSFKFDIVVK